MTTATNFDILKRLNRLERSFGKQIVDRDFNFEIMQFLDNRVRDFPHEESPC